MNEIKPLSEGDLADFNADYINCDYWPTLKNMRRAIVTIHQLQSEIKCLEKNLSDAQGDIAEEIKQREKLEAEIETARMNLCRIGLLHTQYDTLPKAVSGITEMVKILRQIHANPPPDVQEQVIKMLDLVHRSMITQLEQRVKELEGLLDSISSACASDEMAENILSYVVTKLDMISQSKDQSK